MTTRLGAARRHGGIVSALTRAAVTMLALFGTIVPTSSARAAADSSTGDDASGRRPGANVPGRSASVADPVPDDAATSGLSDTAADADASADAKKSKPSCASLTEMRPRFARRLTAPIMSSMWKDVGAHTGLARTPCASIRLYRRA